MKLAKEFNVQNPGDVVVVDPDGDKIASGASTMLQQVIDAAVKAWSDKPISWGGALEDAVKQAKEKGKIVLAAWADDRKAAAETLKNLEDKSVAKLHDKFVFVKLPYAKDAQDVKDWKVNSAPTLIVLDPEKFEVGKWLDKVSGSLSKRALKDFLQKALRKHEEAKKK